MAGTVSVNTDKYENNMKTIVVNATALRYSGALSILRQFLETIPEEIMHAKRLEKAFEAHGIQFDKIEC